MYMYIKVIQCSLLYKTTPSANKIWSYKAGGLSSQIGIHVNRHHGAQEGGLIQQGGLCKQGSYNAGITVNILWQVLCCKM